MFNVLFLEGINKNALIPFDDKTKFNIEYINHAIEENVLIEKIQNIHIIGIRSKTELSSKVLEHATNLIIIGCLCIGTNQVDLDYCSKNNISVVNSPFMNSRSVSELVISLIISLSRKLGDVNMDMHKGIWNKSSNNCHEIRGRTLGIIGYGHVGQQVSILAEHMGMNVIYYDIIPVLGLGNSKSCSMIDLLKKSDFITIHVPETKITKGFFGKEQLKLMKENSYLLNLSRGSVVDLNSVREYIDNGKLAGLAIDVYPNEPKTKINNWKNVLQGAKNTILTPHIGGSTEEAQILIADEVGNKIYKYITQGCTMDSITLPKINIPQLHNNIRIINFHKNIKGSLYEINNLVNSYNINIINQHLATKGEIGLCIIDIELDEKNKINLNDFIINLNKLDISYKTRTISN